MEKLGQMAEGTHWGISKEMCEVLPSPEDTETQRDDDDVSSGEKSPLRDMLRGEGYFDTAKDRGSDGTEETSDSDTSAEASEDVVDGLDYASQNDTASFPWVTPTHGTGSMHVMRIPTAEDPVALCRTEPFKGGSVCGEGMANATDRFVGRKWCPACVAKTQHLPGFREAMHDIIM